MRTPGGLGTACRESIFSKGTDMAIDTKNILSEPSFLKQVSKSVIREIDTSNAFLDALISLKINHTEGLYFAYSIIQDYLNGAKIQHRRIFNLLKKIQNTRQNPTTKKDVLGCLFREIHFYLISWEIVHQLSEFIRNETRFKNTGIVIRQYSKKFQERKNARNKFEHISEGLKGKTKTNRSKASAKNPNNICNLINESLIFQEVNIDIGSNSINILKDFSKVFSLAILYDSLETIYQKEPDRLSKLILRADKDLKIKKIQSKFSRGEF